MEELTIRRKRKETKTRVPSFRITPSEQQKWQTLTIQHKFKFLADFLEYAVNIFAKLSEFNALGCTFYIKKEDGTMQEIQFDFNQKANHHETY